MNIITFILSIILSLFSISVMSYVALATPIGPWIAPTLVFITLLCSRFIIRISSSNIAYAVSAGSVGGIMATACAFSFPTIYFLDPILFNEWMRSPLFFSGMLGGFSFLAGMFGFLVAEASEKTLLETQQLSFPIGHLIHKMIAAQNQIKKAYELMIGFCGALLFSFMQGGLFLHKALIPKVITIFYPCKFLIFSLPRVVVNMDIAPMIWAIGFVTGHVIAIPLAIGACANVFFVAPLQKIFFSYVTPMEFILAFCSGIVLYITVMSVIGMPQQIIAGVKKGMLNKSHKSTYLTSWFCTKSLTCVAVLTASLIAFLSYFKFPYYVQIYLIICSIITTYQIAAIAGRIGLALLGRFATFVMVPAMLMFNINYVQMVFIATFVEMSGGVAADLLFSRKLALLSDISRTTMRWYQLLGLIISSASIGIVFWFLINHFGLGSSELFAYRAQSRQLLIQAQQFDYIVVIIGAIFGLILQAAKLNPMLVLGGLLMPLDITLGLVAGGFIALTSSDKEEWYPLWSGVFAGNSLSMLLRAIFRI